VVIQTLVITWRETLEAALIVGILLTYLGRSGQQGGRRYVWLGAVAGVLAAFACGALSGGVVTLLEPETQEVIQAGILFLAVGVLSWMVLWMSRHARAIRGELQRKADRVLEGGGLAGLAAIAFIAVFREGMETVLFLWGVVLQRGVAAQTVPLLATGVAGAALAVASAWLFFRGFAFLSLQTFFRVTGVLLLLVAAGMLTSGVNKLIGLDYLPPLVPQVWNTSWLVRDGSPLGAVLGALIGYRSRPSLLEVLAFVSYFPPMLLALRCSEAGQRAPAPSSAARSAA
jgi:high-affinity iron transporter